MIQIRNLTKTFGKQVALDIPKLEVLEGECIGIVGNNGAGKTTLFKLMLDLLKPETGRVSIDGEQVEQSSSWKQSLNAFIDESFLIDFLTPKEYLQFVLAAKNDEQSVENLLSHYPAFSNGDIEESRKYIRDLSTGTKVRVGVYSLLAGNPKYLLLDEPFAHIDPTSQKRLSKLLLNQKELNRTVIVSSHNLQNIADCCDRMILLEDGKIRWDVSVNDKAMADLTAYFDAQS